MTIFSCEWALGGAENENHDHFQLYANEQNTQTGKKQEEEEEEFLDFQTFTSVIISGDNRRTNRIEKKM